jgi:heme exporter protein B
MTLLKYLKKDFAIELRDRSYITSIFTLLLMVAVMITLGTHLAIIPHASLARILPTFTWVSFILVQTITINRSFIGEFELGAIESLAASEGNLRNFYQSKSIINSLIGIIAFIFFIICLSLLLPAEAARVGVYSSASILSLMIAIVAYSSLATVLIPISITSSLKDVLMAILLIPLSFPIFFAAIEICTSAATGIPLEWDSPWISLLLLICAIYIPLGSVLFEYTVKQ